MYLFISSALLAATFYAADTFFDLRLGIRHVDNRDYMWGSATLVCVLIPWINNLVAHCLYRKNLKNKTEWSNPTNYNWMLILTVGSVLNIFPSTALICAAWYKWKGMNITAEKIKTDVTTIRLVEVVFEAFPQSCLQIYIIGQTNHLDSLLIFSTATSLWSVGNGIFQGSFQAVERWSNYANDYGIHSGRQQMIQALLLPAYKKDRHYASSHAILTALIFQPWVLFSILCYLPPVALLASLKDHSGPGTSAAIIYLLLHLVLGVILANVKARRRIRFACGFSLQLLFTFAVIWISTAWFVSLAPFLDTASLDRVPSFVWPNAPSVMKKWILDPNATAINPSWAVCNSTSTTTVVNAAATAASTTTTTITAATRTAFDDALSMSLCLTDIAVPLYYFFVAASTFLFVYTLVVILLLWPRISEKWKREWEERGPEREREEEQRKREFDRERKLEVENRKGERNVNLVEMEGTEEAEGKGTAAEVTAAERAAASEETSGGAAAGEGSVEAGGAIAAETATEGGAV